MQNLVEPTDSSWLVHESSMEAIRRRQMGSRKVQQLDRLRPADAAVHLRIAHLPLHDASGRLWQRALRPRFRVWSLRQCQVRVPSRRHYVLPIRALQVIWWKSRTSSNFTVWFNCVIIVVIKVAMVPASSVVTTKMVCSWWRPTTSGVEIPAGHTTWVWCLGMKPEKYEF